MKTFNLFNGDTDEVPPGAPGHPGRAARVGSKLGAERLGMSVVLRSRRAKRSVRTTSSGLTRSG